MAGRLMGQLQGAARTGGVADLIQLSRLFNDPKWSEELEEFVIAAAQQAEATEKLGSLEEIERLKGEAVEILGKARLGVTVMFDEAEKELEKRAVKMRHWEERITSTAAELNVQEIAVAQDEVDVRDKRVELTKQEAKLVERAREVEVEWEEARASKVDYDELIAKVKAALPGVDDASG